MRFESRVTTPPGTKTALVGLLLVPGLVGRNRAIRNGEVLQVFHGTAEVRCAVEKGDIFRIRVRDDHGEGSGVMEPLEVTLQAIELVNTPSEF